MSFVWSAIKDNLRWALFAILIVGLAWWLNRAAANLTLQDALLRARMDTVVALNDSTKAVVTRTSAQRDQLQAALTTAQQLNGQLAAAVQLKIAAIKDSVQIELQTLRSGQVRYASWHDSTENYSIEGHVTAPDTGAIGVRYTIQLPELKPTIAFVRIGNTEVATVTMGKRQYTLDAPYFDPRLVIPSRWSANAGGGWDLADGRPVLEVDASYHLWGRWTAAAQANYIVNLGEHPHLFVLLKRSF